MFKKKTAPKPKPILPESLYVYRDVEDEDGCLIANETERECLDIDEARLVGVYELKDSYRIAAAVSRD